MYLTHPATARQTSAFSSRFDRGFLAAIVEDEG
jgi:hypothetical protein